MTRDEVIAKVQKIMSVVNDTTEGNHNVREVAIQKAQKLIEQYNISLEEIEGNIEEKDYVSETVYASNALWARLIISSICKMNFCGLIRYKYSTTKNKYLICGNKANVSFSIIMFNALIKSVAKQARIGAAIHRTTGYARSFENSASHTICNRCNSIIKSAIETSNEETEGRALVVKNMYETAEETFKEYFKKVTGKDHVIKVKTVRVTNYQGHQDGVAFGKKAVIS